MFPVLFSGPRKAASSITYLVRDQFTTDLAAGSVNGTAAEPGPGTRTVVDTGSKLSITGGAVSFTGKASPTDGDPGLWYASQARAIGRAILCDINLTSGTRVIIGWDTDQTGLISSGAIWFATSNTIQTRGLQNIGLPDVYAYSTAYTVAIIMRSPGFWVAIKGGVFTDWTLIQVEATAAGTPLFPGWGNLDDVGTLDNFRVFDLGGVWATQNGPATNVVASPSTGATTTMTAEGIVEFTWTVATGETLELDVRRTDASNRWCIRCSQAGSTIKLIEINAGVETERSSVAQTWTNATAFRIVAICTGNKIYTYVTGVAKSTYASASFNNTATGVAVAGFATGANLIAWPRAIAIPNS